MLTDQHIIRPLHFIVGPLVFHEDNAMGVNLRRLKDFQTVIVPSGMFRFTYVAFRQCRHYGEQGSYTDRLKQAGVPLDVVLVQQRKDQSANQEMLQELLYVADGYAKNRCLRALGVSRHRNEFPLGAESFVKALTIQAQTSAAFDWSTFKSFGRLD